MNFLNSVWAWIMSHKNISSIIALALCFLIVGLIFGSKIRGCIDTMKEPIETAPVEKIVK
jgi:hypothetical protein